jgi:hypothetical protein
MSKMTQADFLADFNEYQFPQELGPSIGYADHDPPFKIGDLWRMHKAGLIVLDEANQSYQLTLLATKKYEAAK